MATTTSGIDSPTIQQRRIKTTVSVNDGKGIVLGGLIQDKATNTRNQAPLVGDIPLFGNLFKNKDDRSTDRAAGRHYAARSSRITDKFARSPTNSAIRST